MSRKRQLEEIDQLDQLTQPIANASLHAAVTSLSPVKKGRKSTYFDAKLTDGAGNIRMVGFNSEHQKKLSTFQRQKLPIKLEDCEVRKSRQGYSMEILLKNTTIITESSKDIDTSQEDPDDSPTAITLLQLSDIQLFQKITTSAKVIQVSDTITVTGGKKKQEVTIADDTSTAKVTLWEQYIGILQDGKSYKLNNFVVREYKNIKFLSMPREGSTITEIEDIGDVEEVPLDSDGEERQQLKQLSNAQIIGVPHLDMYKACMRCKARVEPLTPPLGRCSRPDCLMIQRFDFCKEQLSAKLMFMHGREKEIDTLHAFGKMVEEIADEAEGEQITVEGLLHAPMMETITYNDKKIINGFSRETCYHHFNHRS